MQRQRRTTIPRGDAVLWLRYLTEINEKTREAPADLLANPQISKALSELRESAFSEAQLLGYEKFWDIISMDKTLCSSYPRKGKAEGLAEGEIKSQRLIAANSKKRGVDAATIAQCTGLSIVYIS